MTKGTVLCENHSGKKGHMFEKGGIAAKREFARKVALFLVKKEN